MAISLIKDDNYEPLPGFAGLRPDFVHGVDITTGASITETSIASLNIAGNQNAQKQVLITVTAITNACYFSVGPASSAPGSSQAMMLIPINQPIPLKLNSTDLSAYTQQITGAATVKIVAWT